MAAKLLLSAENIRNYWAKVQKAGPDDCWPWIGWRNDNGTGHGRFEVARQKLVATHVALILDGRPRPPPPNDNALHGDCSNRWCCNPNHLRWGTALENAEDRDRLGRRIALRGEDHGVAKLTEDDVRHIRRSDLSQRRLAKELGVSQPLVGKIRRRLLWAHVA